MLTEQVSNPVLLPSPLPPLTHPTSGMPGHISPSHDGLLNAPSLHLGTEETEKGSRNHNFSMFISKQDSGPKVDFSAASGQS